MRNSTMYLAICALLLGIAFSCLLEAPQALAKADPNRGNDAMFVLDASYSMRDTDKEGIAAEVVKLFMDMSNADRTRVGFVAYNHKIVKTKPLTTISVKDKKTEIKKALSSLPRSGYTDLGLGLLTGTDLLAKRTESGNRPFLLLLSDGGTDFGPMSKGRSVADSNRDVEKAIKQAKAKGFPIYTIGLNQDGSVNQAELKRIATETGGTSFITDSAEDLPEIFNKIFAKQIQSTLISVAAVTATGALQEVSLSIPNGSMNEANIILLSEHPVKEAQLFSQAKNIQFTESNKYSLLKVAQPPKGNVTLKFRGTPGNLVKINLLGTYNLDIQAPVLSNQTQKGQATSIVAHLIDSQSKKFTDQDVNQTLKAEFITVHLATKQEQRTPMNLVGDEWKLEHVFKQSGDYTWKIRMEGPDFYRETSVEKLHVGNLAPQATAQRTISISKESGESGIDLGKYFTDANQDTLTYKIITAPDESVSSLSIQDQTLHITPLTTGTTTLTITAIDPDGEQATSELSLIITSVWDKYLVIGGILLATALIGGIIYLIVRPKPKLSGKLEGYFLQTASGNDIPVTYWPLSSFPQRRITLQELFRSLNVNEPLPEAAYIVFEAGKNGTLLVKNNSNCILVRGTTLLRINKKEILTYNDKLYITFEDEITEIELRYKAVKVSSHLYSDVPTNH
ncbi:vWA domain-containing protein [Brevibacillus laterosporus]|uniref:vWA domain-containing protein n=1 Tax=Brevibacillus laterosporus TaxID=1465 RepID=UPI001EF19A43|nr:vWA domain-containing protein [Brevibacillus laterosporus]MCG7316189.1 VWA domain-containing protein [Brevibacillus laterosporus]